MLKKITLIAFYMLSLPQRIIGMNSDQKQAIKRIQHQVSQHAADQKLEITHIKQELHNMQEELKRTQEKVVLLGSLTINPQLLLQACQDGKLEEVKKLINLGAPLDAQNEGGWTPLHKAVNNKYREIVEFLLQHNASTDIQNCYHRTALHIAAFHNDTNALIEPLLQHNTRIDMQDDHGNTPLHDAINCGAYDHGDVKLALIKRILGTCFFLPKFKPLPNTNLSTEDQSLLELMKKLEVNNIANSSLVSLKDHNITLIIDQLPLDHQKALVRTWRQYKKVDSIKSLLAAHCQRHLILLQQTLKIQNKNHETPRGAAMKNNNIYIAAFLEHISKATHFEKLGDDMRSTINTTIRNKLAIDNYTISFSNSNS